MLLCVAPDSRAQVDKLAEPTQYLDVCDDDLSAGPQTLSIVSHTATLLIGRRVLLCLPVRPRV